MDVMATENAAFLPTVYVVTNNSKRSEELGGVLSQFFDITVFDTTSKAGKALIEKVPAVVLVEVELTRKGGLDPLLTSADGANGGHPPFVFIGQKGEVSVIKTFGTIEPVL